MDVDKPLDEMIAEKRQKPQQQNKGEGRPNRGRPSGGKRENPTPYTRPPPRSTEDKWVHDAFQGSRGGAGNGGGRGRDVTAVVGTGAVFTGVSPRIEVVGLHYEVTPADLKTIFSQAGTLVQGPTIRYDRSGRSKGEATMEYATYQQAKIAINKFDGAMTKGQTISIRLLPPIQPRGPGAQAAGNGNGNARAAGGGGNDLGAGSLLSRISGNNNNNNKPKPAGGDNRGTIQGAQRGGRGGNPRGGRGRGGPANRGGNGGRRGPANEGDLDKELDSFMAGDKGGEDVAMA